MVATCGLKHIGHEFCGYGSSRFVFFVLSCVGEVGKDGGDAAGRGGLAGVYHDEELHYAVVDIAWGRGLEYEDWLGVRAVEM